MNGVRLTLVVIAAVFVVLLLVSRRAAFRYGRLATLLR